VRPPEVGPFEMRVPEVGPFEMRELEVGFFEIRAPEVGPFESQILRFYHAEKWTIGTIARQLHIRRRARSILRRTRSRCILAASGLPPTWMGLVWS
jgi:hypothetical protein